MLNSEILVSTGMSHITGLTPFDFSSHRLLPSLHYVFIVNGSHHGSPPSKSHPQNILSHWPWLDLTFLSHCLCLKYSVIQVGAGEGVLHCSNACTPLLIFHERSWPDMAILAYAVHFTLMQARTHTYIYCLTLTQTQCMSLEVINSHLISRPLQDFLSSWRVHSDSSRWLTLHFSTLAIWTNHCCSSLQLWSFWLLVQVEDVTA